MPSSPPFKLPDFSSLNPLNPLNNINTGVAERLLVALKPQINAMIKDTLQQAWNEMKGDIKTMIANELMPIMHKLDHILKEIHPHE